MNISEINEAITELENSDTNFNNCQKLAILYTVKDHFDLVPNSSIDENINKLLNDFVSYYNSSTYEQLEHITTQLTKIILELYHTCDTQDKKGLINNLIDTITKIAT